MSESTHATPLGDLADLMDEVADRNAAILEWWSYGILSKMLGGSGTRVGDAVTLVGWALPDATPVSVRGAIKPSMEAAWAFGTGEDGVRGYIDVLRFGDGFQSGTFWGYATEGSRVLSMIPVAKYGSPYIKKALGSFFAGAIIQQYGIEANCSWKATAKILRMMGEKPFASVNGLKRVVGKAGYLTADRSYLPDLVNGLGELGLKFRPLGAGNLQRLLEMSRTWWKGAIVFSIEFDGGTHSLIARGGKFIDTYAHTFASVEALQRIYPKATLMVRGIIEHSYYIDEVAVAASPLVAALGITGVGGSSLLRGPASTEPWLRNVGIDQMLAVPMTWSFVEIRDASATLRSFYPKDYQVPIPAESLPDSIPALVGPLG